MEDKWYVSVNGHSDPTVYNLESVEEILKDSRSDKVYVIHVTQTPIDGLEGWVKLQPNDAPTLKKSFTKDQENQESLVDGRFDAEKEVDEVFYGNEEPLGFFGLERIKKWVFRPDAISFQVSC